ncbi:hypothetical protein FB567DRAFT_350785 [Paraphoma chrysanthemicola]|uniref:Secreted protein n=1 Tax=Paraphoma chrysanthemicola TaxID=798071 RepID=A0A8K0VZM1_9PLEO|nr:hypothetical protein FB567DRAFT_350785 [Paraphoma chrysanthemicola]
MYTWNSRPMSSWLVIFLPVNLMIGQYGIKYPAGQHYLQMPTEASSKARLLSEQWKRRVSNLAEPLLTEMCSPILHGAERASRCRQTFHKAWALMNHTADIPFERSASRHARADAHNSHAYVS